jgi:lipooligosaccharide transport system permease protein
MRRVFSGPPVAGKQAGGRHALPLTHAIDLARPLTDGAIPPQALLYIGVLPAYTLIAFYVSPVLFRRRLSR